MSNIVETAISANTFNTLVAAVKAAGLVETLSGSGPYTVFAPLDSAFAAVPEATIQSLLRPENKAQLVDILTYHVVSGRISSTDLIKHLTVKSVLGQELMVNAASGVKINGANVVAPDIECDNGIVHVIDAVLMPKVPVA